MSTNQTIRLCELATKLEQDWRDLYTAAFPSSEREPESKLQNHIDSGRLLFHKTIGKQGELLCFSMVSLAPDFSLLAYIATDPKQRSGGYGSKHMRALLDYMKQHYPEHLGLMLEIESTNPKSSKPEGEEKAARQRRLAFYRRLGAKRLCRQMQYLVPSKSGSGELELDLLYFRFGEKVPEQETKKRIVKEIFQRFYELPAEDPLIARAISGIGPCLEGKCEDQEDEPANADQSLHKETSAQA